MRHVMILSIVAVSFGVAASGWLAGTQLPDPMRPHGRSIPVSHCDRAPTMQLLPLAENQTAVFPDAVYAQRNAYEHLIFPRANQLNGCARLIQDPGSHLSVQVEITHLGHVETEQLRGALISEELRQCVSSIVHRWVFPSGPQEVVLDLPIQDCPVGPAPKATCPATPTIERLPAGSLTDAMIDEGVYPDTRRREQEEYLDDIAREDKVRSWLRHGAYYSLASCYGAAAPAGTAPFEVVLAVGRTGFVSSVLVRGEGLDDVFKKCVHDQAITWPMPSGVGELLVRVPIVSCAAPAP